MTAKSKLNGSKLHINDKYHAHKDDAVIAFRIERNPRCMDVNRPDVSPPCGMVPVHSLYVNDRKGEYLNDSEVCTGMTRAGCE